ncbi:lipid A biosynthesis lauroyl acyltransferase, partial [Enterobacter hormaechei]|nr:lipid A biosynthesis lauroyl acyltransferase [Enterobacter hormaechei]
MKKLSFYYLYLIWFSWAGIAALWCTVQLPYSLLLKAGRGLGRLAMRMLPRRVEIARRILELCFPEMKEGERERLLERNFDSV